MFSSTHFSWLSGVAMPSWSWPRRTSSWFIQRAYAAARSRRSGPSATFSPTTMRSGSWRSMGALSRTPQRAVDRLRRLAADQAAQQDLGRRREHPWLAAQRGDARAPVLARDLERVAQRPVAEEVRPRGAEVAVDVEAEADLRPLGDPGWQHPRAELAQQRLALGLDTELERQVQREARHRGIEEGHAGLDRALHRVLVLAVEEVRQVGAQRGEQRRLVAAPRAAVARVGGQR